MPSTTVHNNRHRPHIRIPEPPLPPIPVSEIPDSDHAVAFPTYSIEVTPPPYTEVDENPEFGITWDTPTPDTARPRVYSMGSSPRPLSRTLSAGTGDTVRMPFPEPQIHRASSYTPMPQLARARSHSQVGTAPTLGLQAQQSTVSLASSISSYNQDHDSDHYYGSGSEHSHNSEDFSRELSNLSLNAEEALRRFQAGELLEVDQAWHRLVPSEARDALGKREVQRQSVLFEVFKAERDYVNDLETIEEVYINGLRNASPPIIPPQYLHTYIHQVFGNLDRILALHQRMLGALLERQREQHPVVQSIADIILDAVLLADFRSTYEAYIEHYPLSESFHRTEQKRNPAYRQFVQSVSLDPRIRKRDLITFLSRPVTRLPRLNLVLEQILKLTDKEFQHPDLETLPIILGVLGDFIKSTQPGIEAAESKVKLWALNSGLIFQKGEIIDLEMLDDERALLYSGPLLRLTRSGSGWSSQPTELTGSLLDHYFLLTRDEKRSSDQSGHHLVSRPLSLSYLRLGSFTSPPELQKERPEDGRLLDSFRSATVTVYPFTIYHASSKSSRRYTFYVSSEASRQRWHSAFVDGLAVYKARQEGNMWFYPRTLTDRFFRVMGLQVPYGSNARLSGKVTCAVPFLCGGTKFIAIGCQTGIYVSIWGVEEYRRVFTYSNPSSIAAIMTAGAKVYNKFIVHTEGSLLSYPLEVVAQAALGKIQSSTALAATMERVASPDMAVVFFRYLQLDDRALVVFTCKRRLQSTMDLHVVEAVPPSVLAARKASSSSRRLQSFIPFGESGYVPRDAFDICLLTKKIGICSKDGIVVLDPKNLTSPNFLMVPDLRNASADASVRGLKGHLEGARPLGLVPLPRAQGGQSEVLVVFDLVGCYVTSSEGVPSREARFIKWETKATSYVRRRNYVFLLSPQFIEIRNIITGTIIQVIEGADIRLLYPGYTGTEILVAMRGSKDDKEGTSEKILELAETSEIPVVTPATPSVSSVWDEWDM